MTMTGLQDNRTLSPFTGWTRDHWLHRTGRMVAGFMRYFDPETGLPDFPANPDETGLADAVVASGGKGEMFSRPMMMAALYMTAAGMTRVNGYDHDVADMFRRGLHTVFITGDETVPLERTVIALTLAQLYCPKEFLDGIEPAVPAFPRTGKPGAAALGRG